MTTLVIVESPNKAKSISRYLGAGYTVIGSYGHIRDLPVSPPPGEYGVDMATLEPQYEITAKARQKGIVGRLRDAAKSADRVLLATDPDREGEAIAYHLACVLGKRDYGRVTFHEVNAAAVKAAVANPGVVDERLVRAQEARRVADRLAGYMVSPALSRVAGRQLSAGRVQSVAVRLIVDREREIAGFVPTTHYGVQITLPGAGQDANTWAADWDFRSLLPEGQSLWLDRATAEAVAAGTKVVEVVNVTKKEKRRGAPAPFTTSTLQQAGSNTLKIGVDKVMDLAQRLFEGPEGFDEGVITYHRTDSPNLSEKALGEVRQWLTEKGHAVPEKPNTWKAKADAQGAHEAIRPTDFALENLPVSDPLMAQLYRMIWERAVASQMQPARYDVTTIELVTPDAVHGQRQKFRATGRVLVDPGWLALTRDHTEEEGKGEGGEQAMPVVQGGQQFSVIKSVVQNKKTEPPSRYKEASLVKALEDHGIGRPSTYASIVGTIQRHGFVTIDKKNRTLAPTEIGASVRDTLVGRFSFLELNFTRDMEEALDQVASGSLSYRDVVGAFYGRLQQELPSLETADVVIGEQHPCPSCGKPLQQRKGKSGLFWGCTGYPECNVTMPDDHGKPGKPLPKGSVGTCQCGGEIHESQMAWQCQACNAIVWKSTCGKKLTATQAIALLAGKTVELKGLRSKAKKPFDANARIEDGKVKLLFEDKAKSGPAAKAGDKCPSCKKGSIKRKTIDQGKNAGKPFYGCTRFPDCRHFEWAPQES